VPAVVGTPAIAPPAERLSPGGREPEDSDQVIGAAPPVDPSDALYATPCTADGSAVVVMTNGVAGAMTKDSDSVAAAGVGVAESVASAENLNVPDAVGVPQSSPTESSVIPAGRAPEATDHV
jgi:hypothetical protein